jgi:hypothetical protein
MTYGSPFPPDMVCHLEKYLLSFIYTGGTSEEKDKDTRYCMSEMAPTRQGQNKYPLKLTN